jgi:hypothetical protein
MNSKDIIYLSILFVVAMALWTIPALVNQYPYGEGDAAHQYGEADWRAIDDTAQRAYPEFLARWYGPNQNDYYAPGNAAPFAIDSALIQQVTGERFLPKTLFLIFLGVIPLIFGIYLLISRLYDPEAAFVSSFFLIFSMRDILAHLFGQRLVLFSLAYVPIILYCYYRYTESYNQGKEKGVYIFLTALISSLGALFHPQMLAIAGGAILLYTIYLTIRYKKLPFSFRWAIISIALFLVILLPFVSDWATQNQASPGKLSMQQLGSLFAWYPNGVSWDQIGGWPIIILFIIGIAMLIFNHEDKDVLMLCWLVALYFALHLNVIGLYESRLDRFLKGSAHVIYPICILGIYYISSMLKRSYLKYILYSAVIVLIISTNGVSAYKMMSDAYPAIQRMTDEQYAAAQWIDANLPQDAIVYTIGSATYPKQRWMNMLSHRSFEVNHPQEGDGALYPNATHIMIDFSDAYALKNRDWSNALVAWEQHYNLSFITPIYSEGGIYIYER